ncbi:MAG: hypothetical protein Q7L07_01600 [Pseudohongiella sp.]|nr:hypothetical protein [Pseudohongiella sp.]
MKRIYTPTQSGTDWQRLLGKPKLHWKKGRSAMSAAACWEESQPRLPAEISALLDSCNDPAISGLDMLLAIPEWEVALPGGETVSQTDIMAICRNNSGLVILGVEAKVDEPFGPTLAEKKSGASKGQLERIAYLEQELGRSTPFGDEIRYQLLHRTVSALLTARAFHAPVAIMLIQSFSPESKWSEDFSAFCAGHLCTQLAPGVYEIQGIKGPRLIVGWCKGNAKYLYAELPSAFD